MAEHQTWVEPCPSCGAEPWAGMVCCIRQAIRERDEARAEVALMRAEVESQEVAHREEVARYQASLRDAARAHALEVSRWRPAALQYAGQLARLGHAVTLPDAASSTEGGEPHG